MLVAVSSAPFGQRNGHTEAHDDGSEIQHKSSEGGPPEPVIVREKLKGNN